MRRSSFFKGFGPSTGLPPVVKYLLIANLAVFFVSYVLDGNPVKGNFIYSWFGLVPHDVWRGAFWQPITYMFLHHGFAHLFFNMLLLWMFGSVLETVWGSREFLKYYLLTGVVPGVLNAIISSSSTVPIIGASGSIYGLLTAYGLLFPNSTIYIYFLFPIRVKYVVIFLGAMAFLMSVRTLSGEGGNQIAHIVHLGGMVVGAIYLKHRTFLAWGAQKVKSWQFDRARKQVQRQVQEENQLRQEVDDLLDKINEVGIDNLTSWEKNRLKQASARLQHKQDENER